MADQKQFWTSPARFRTKDLKWILPSVGITAAFIASDSWWSRQVNPSHQQTSLNVSDYGTYSLIGLGGASFLFGSMTHDDHLQETGLLSAEAAINATGVTYLFKEITQRQRPLQGNGNGDFFTGGSSFFSEHSAIAWSIASVWAHEYPGWLSQMAAYGLASTITITRVTAKQHFPSDVIVGSALGWYFGRQVYRAHHDPEVGGSPWGNLVEEHTGDKVRNPSLHGFPLCSAGQLDLSLVRASDRFRLHAIQHAWECVRGLVFNVLEWWRRLERSSKTDRMIQWKLVRSINHLLMSLPRKQRDWMVPLTWVRRSNPFTRE